MKTYIEDLLLKKTDNKRSKIFYTQWQLAKEYVPQILGIISHTFPHYSLHDRTHSDTIINNIVRIIGKETVEKFSAVDLWLLLSSAYYHDIGMAVFAIDKENIFNDEKFLEYIKNIQDDKASSLYDYSLSLEIKDNKIYYKNSELNSFHYDSARFLLAEFIRTKHSERSEESIYKHVSMNLPGSPIPDRIISLLANICYNHTQSFERVMQLPSCEAGIDSDDCHPRYIACLLRLGDLLDIDNNRFSEVLLQTIKNIPIDSILHNEKHLSIKHIRIDKQLIELKAVCETYEVADLTNRWFKMLDEEMANQMKKWNYIIPNSDYGFLPTLGDLIVELKNYDTIDGKLRPSFQVDSSKSIELLQGAGLYSEKHQCIRELLQNSVDATFLRIWIEADQENNAINRDIFLKRCKELPISIRIQKKEQRGEMILWDVVIVDSGVGMSKEDLFFLTNTGSSSKNKSKIRIIDSMPEWMKPSGTFGIGFQSIFLLSKKVNLKTRKINKEVTFDIELNDPAGKKEGAILVKTVIDGKRKYGSELCFSIEVDKNTTSWTIKSEQQTASNTVNSFDFVQDESLDIEVAKIIDEIFKFSWTSYIPLKLKIEDNEELTLTSEELKPFSFYCDEKNIELIINKSGYRTSVYFRNQFVEKSINDYKYLSFNINILGGNAKDILTLNRNEIQSNYKSKLWSDVLEAALLILSVEYKNLSDDIKIWASMFIEFYGSNSIHKDLFVEKDFSDWKNLELDIEIDESTKKIKILDLIERYDKIFLVEKELSQKKSYEIKQEKKSSEIVIKYNYRDDIVDFLCLKAIKQFKNVSFDTYDINGKLERVIILSKKKEKDLINNWKLWFSRYFTQHHYARNVMPCNEKYKKLELKKDFDSSWAYDSTFSNPHFSYPIMICPYIRKYKETGFFSITYSLELSLSDQLYQMVYDNRADESVSLKQIKDSYSEFIEDVNSIVEDLNNEAKKSK